MGQKAGTKNEVLFSVAILKEHIDEIPIRNLDSDWIMQNKVELGSIMEDRSKGILHRNATHED